MSRCKRYGGIDPSASEAKPTGCVLLDSSGTLLESVMLHTDRDIVMWCIEAGVTRLAIDAPQGLPFGMGLCCLNHPTTCRCEPTAVRSCERELLRRRISLYPITRNAFPAAKAWALRGLLLFLRFQAMGIRCDEVYPSACKKRLFPDTEWIKPKAKKAARWQLQSLLSTRVSAMPDGDKHLLTDHELDALLAAYTVWLDETGGATERVGDPAEGQILLPSG